MITTADLKSTTTRELSDNLIRKSWVLQLPQEIKDAYLKIPQAARFELYNTIDRDVRKAWVKKMRDYKQTLLDQGVKMNFDLVTGVETLPSQYLIETEELLVSAASNVVDEIVSDYVEIKKAK